MCNVFHADGTGDKLNGMTKRVYLLRQ